MERQRKSGFISRLFGLFIIFAAGVALGYYLGERGKADAVTEAIRRTETELQSRARSAAERGGAALQSLEGGAAAAAESTKAAVRSLGGDTARR